MAFTAWKRSMFGRVDGVQSSLEHVKEKQTAVAHLRPLEEGLGKILKLIEASFDAKV